MCSTCGCKGAESFCSECGTKRAESFGADGRGSVSVETSIPYEWYSIPNPHPHDDKIDSKSINEKVHEEVDAALDQGIGPNGFGYDSFNEIIQVENEDGEMEDEYIDISYEFGNQLGAESFEAEDKKIEGYVALGGDRYANYAYVSTNAEKLKQAFKDSFMETRYDFEEEELEKMWSNFSPKEALEAVGMYLKKVDLSKVVFIYDGDADALDAESSKDDDDDDDDELDEEEEYKMMMRENEALQREEENEKIVRAIRKDRGDEYYAESFEAPKSPALKNLSTIAVLALAIFVGKKLKE